MVLPLERTYRGARAPVYVNGPRIRKRMATNEAGMLMIINDLIIYVGNPICSLAALGTWFGSEPLSRQDRFERSLNLTDMTKLTYLSLEFSRPGSRASQRTAAERALGLRSSGAPYESHRTQ